MHTTVTAVDPGPALTTVGVDSELLDAAGVYDAQVAMVLTSADPLTLEAADGEGRTDGWSGVREEARDSCRAAWVRSLTGRAPHPDAQRPVMVWDDDFSIQIEGTFDEPTGADEERLRNVFAMELPKEAGLRTGRPNHLYFRITPTWARFTDLSAEPPRVLTLDFSTGTETRGTWPVPSTPRSAR